MRRRVTLVFAALILTVCLAGFGREFWLAALGRYIAGSSRELKASWEIVVVPAADYLRADVGRETLAEAERLVHEGRARQIVMSCADLYGVSECELAERVLHHSGRLRARIEWLRTERLPDEVEADLAIRHLKRNGTGSAIILLPNYKARRLGRVYRRLGGRSGIEVDVMCLHGEFDPERWWRSGEGQKRFAEELVKLAGVL